MINNLPEVIEVLNRHFNTVFIFLYILTLSKSLRFALVSKLLKVCPLISFGITKHFQDFDNSIKVFTEFSIFPLISDMEQRATKTLRTSLDIYMSSREIIYQALAIVRSDRNGQVVVLNEDILSNQA